MSFQGKPDVRPIIKIQRSLIEVVLEVTSFLGITISIFILLFFWQKLPDIIPTHFSISGIADGWSKKETLIILPVISTVTYLGLTALRHIPHLFNYPIKITEQNAEQQYRLALSLLGWLKTETVWLFLFIEWKMIFFNFGETIGLGAGFFPIVLLIILGTIVYYMVLAFRYR